MELENTLDSTRKELETNNESLEEALIHKLELDLELDSDLEPEVQVKKSKGRPPRSKNKPKEAPEFDFQEGSRTRASSRLQGHGASFLALPRHIQDSQAFIASMKADPLEPASYKQAISSQDSIQWKKAMEEEYKALIQNKTWKLV